MELSLPWPDPTSSAAKNAIEEVLRLLDAATASIRSGPVAAPVDAAGLKEWLNALSFEEPSPPEQAITQVLEQFVRGSVHTIHTRYFGLFNPAPLLWGEVADMISARLNAQLAIWSHAPAAVEMEQHALRFMAERLEVPHASAFFTSGGEEANRCGVQAALVRSFPDYPDSGLRSLPGQPVLYVSAQSHLAWIKIASGLGLGRSAVRLVPCNEDLQIDVAVLARLIAEDRLKGLLPFFVAATAGTTSAGVIDPLSELADVASQERLHLHVDAAWAGAVALSDQWRTVLCGIDRADSITVDAHKWLSQPMGAGMFFCRHTRALERAFGVSTSYMPPSQPGAMDYYRMTPTWSRRWIGLRLFLSLAIGGRRAFEAQINRDIFLGEQLRQLLVQNGWKIVNRTPLPVICFTDGLVERDSSWHSRVAAHVIASGDAWISTVQLEGMPALRACITNWQTSPEDLETLIGALKRARVCSDAT